MSSNGPIRKPPPMRTIRSIWSCVGDPLAEQPQRLERERARARGWRRSRSRRRRGSAVRPIARRHVVGRRQRLLGGLVAGDHLDQPHQRRRVEEVHAADALGPLDPGGDRGHRQRGGVGGQDRLGAADARPAARTARASARGPRAPPRSPARSRRGPRALGAARSRAAAASASACAPAAALGALGQRRRAAAASPALERLGDRVVEVGLEAAQAGELGDPGAHRPGADDSDPLDRARRLTAP